MTEESGRVPGSREPSQSPLSRPIGFDPARNEPEWLTLAKETVLAIAFQRGTRGEFVVGKDGRVRLGCIDLLGMYAVDEMARKWADYLGIEFPDNLPNVGEQEAMQIMGRRGNWREAIAMETRRAETTGSVAKP
jgi:hypothetical protein